MKLKMPWLLQKRVERMKKFVSIRREVKEGSLESQDGSPGSATGSRSMHYLASYLADSSISSDVSQFDFGTSAGVRSSQLVNYINNFFIIVLFAPFFF